MFVIAFGIIIAFAVVCSFPWVLRFVAWLIGAALTLALVLFGVGVVGAVIAGIVLVTR